MIGSLTVKGLRNTNKRIRQSSAEPAKRSSKLAGKRAASTGGMKRAHAALHSGVNGNCAPHHWRQRSTVRSGTASVPDSRDADADSARRADTSTTATARYTRRNR